VDACGYVFFSVIAFGISTKSFSSIIQQLVFLRVLDVVVQAETSPQQPILTRCMSNDPHDMT